MDVDRGCAATTDKEEDVEGGALRTNRRVRLVPQVVLVEQRDRKMEA